MADSCTDSDSHVKMMSKVDFRHITEKHSVVIAFFTNVKNCSELRSLAMNGTIAVTLLSCKPIIDVFHVLSAVHRAVHNHEHTRLATHNVHTEVIYSLSASKYISDSFKKFGMSDNDHSVIMVLIGSSTGIEGELARIAAYVKGDLTDINQVENQTDDSLVRKVYKIKECETQCGSLLDAVVSRIASKEIVTS